MYMYTWLVHALHMHISSLAPLAPGTDYVFLSYKQLIYVSLKSTIHLLPFSPDLYWIGIGIRAKTFEPKNINHV